MGDVTGVLIVAALHGSLQRQKGKQRLSTSIASVRLGLVFVIIIMSALVSACAVSGGAAGSGHKNVEALVAERATAMWQLKLKGDFDGACAFLSPSYRSAVSARQYRSAYKLGLWRAAEVKSVKCDQSDVCRVEVEIEFQYSAKGSGVVTGKQILPEVWRKDAGDWWNVPYQ